jgi:hypothetical protein
MAHPHNQRRPAPTGSGWTSLVGLGLRLYLHGRIGRLSDTRYWQRQSAGLQLSQLRQLLRAAAKTEFGKAHGFERLAALPNPEILAAYRKAVPVADWYAFRTQIARMREGGEPDVLWPGLVRDFAQTSGTTAGDKFIPVSAEMLRSNYRASLDIFAHLARFGVSLPDLLRGKSVFLGGTTQLDTNAHGIRTGDLSGIVTPLIRWPISEIYLPGREIALMSHWPTKIDAMAKRCLREDVRMVSGMCSWALVLFEKVVELARQSDPSVRTIADVWPNFRVFVHGGVKYAPFDRRVREAYSGSPEGADIPTRLELYPASEGFVAIQDTRGDPGLRLLTDIGNFYEFVPLESINDPDPPAFACHEVEKGQKYVVVMSTCAGLWRYVLGDVVEFDGVCDRPESMGGGGGDGPSRLRIVGRHRHFINAFGENLIVEHIENAVAHAASVAKADIGEFTAAPVYPGEGTRAGLELAFELAGTCDLDLFRQAFDDSLKAQNVDYTTKRTDGVGMGPPTLTPLPPGTFHRWMESRGKLGGQHKCPRCANGRELIEQVRAAGGISTRSTVPVG